MARQPARLLIFDSGVGGLSIFAEIRKQLPWCELTFVSDSAGFPYGTRSEAQLIERVERLVPALLDAYQPDILVVACNSASTVVLPVIRARFATTFVGVVPAIKPASNLSTTRSLGLLATPATISRPYTHQLIADFAGHCKVLPIGSSELVHMAEAKLRGQAIDRQRLAEIIAPFFAEDHQPPIDTIVLACTHFPLLGEELRQAAPREVNWVDSGPAIARRVASLLGTPGDTAIDHHRAVFTGPPMGDNQLLTALGQMGMDDVAYLDI